MTKSLNELMRAKMSSYNTFALFYDSLTENVDYKVRSKYISDFFCKYNKTNCSVLDLACGTGSISKFLSEYGYQVIGMDLSEDMLTVAAGKNIKNARFLKADMTDFRLAQKTECCVCSLDAINHLTDYFDVCRCFENVSNSLNKGGIFVFDVNTIYKHREILCDNTFVFDEEDFFLSWDNHYTDNDIVEIFLDFFVFNGKNYDRFSENFKERAYSIEELTQALTDNSFEILGIYDELTLDCPKEDSERIYFVCRRK